MFAEYVYVCVSFCHTLIIEPSVKLHCLILMILRCRCVAFCVFKEVVPHFGKYTFLPDEIISTTLVSIEA